MRFRGNVIRLLGLRNRTLSFSLILIEKKLLRHKIAFSKPFWVSPFPYEGKHPNNKSSEEMSNCHFRNLLFPPIEPIFPFCVWKIEKPERIVSSPQNYQPSQPISGGLLNQ